MTKGPNRHQVFDDSTFHTSWTPFDRNADSAKKKAFHCLRSITAEARAILGRYQACALVEFGM